SREWLQAGMKEAASIDRLYDEVRAAGPLPDVLLIVLCSMGTDDFKRAVSVGESESLLRDENEGKARRYTALAESVPRGEIRLIDAGHVTMHFRRGWPTHTRLGVPACGCACMIRKPAGTPAWLTRTASTSYLARTAGRALARRS